MRAILCASILTSIGVSHAEQPAWQNQIVLPNKLHEQAWKRRAEIESTQKLLEKLEADLSVAQTGLDNIAKSGAPITKGEFETSAEFAARKTAVTQQLELKARDSIDELNKQQVAAGLKFIEAAPELIAVPAQMNRYDADSQTVSGFAIDAWLDSSNPVMCCLFDGTVPSRQHRIPQSPCPHLVPYRLQGG